MLDQIARSSQRDQSQNQKMQNKSQHALLSVNDSHKEGGISSHGNLNRSGQSDNQQITTQTTNLKKMSQKTTSDNNQMN